jgi:hypothetical protein
MAPNYKSKLQVADQQVGGLLAVITKLTRNLDVVSDTLSRQKTYIIALVEDVPSLTPENEISEEPLEIPLHQLSLASSPGQIVNAITNLIEMLCYQLSVARQAEIDIGRLISTLSVTSQTNISDRALYYSSRDIEWGSSEILETGIDEDQGIAVPRNARPLSVEIQESVSLPENTSASSSSESPPPYRAGQSSDPPAVVDEEDDDFDF